MKQNRQKYTLDSNENDSNEDTKHIEKQAKLFNTNINSIRKDWHFNLRRINSNRAIYLDYKQKQLDENNQNHQNDISFLIKKESLEFDNNNTKSLQKTTTTFNYESNEFDQRLASINLINKQIVHNESIQSIHLPIEKEFDYNNFKFDLNFSLVDQVISTKSAVDQNEITLNKIDPSPIINFKNFEIPIKTSNKNEKPNNPSCVFDYCNQTGSIYATNECFSHVITQFKQNKHFFNISSPTSCNNGKISNYNIFKCEYIFGDNFYWIVKIKRYYESLYQIKLVRNLTNNVQQQRSINNNNDDDFENEANNLPLTPSSPSFSSSINSSLNKTTNDEPSTKLNLNQSFFFTVDSSSSISRHLRPIGWSKTNGRQAQKPLDFNEKTNFSHDLDDTNYFSYFKINSINESYEENSECELQVDNKIYLCKIKRNCAGRLLIEYNKKRVWIFYLDSRLHPIGWAKANNMHYENCEQTYQTNVCQDHELRQRHHFKLNYLMECLYMNKFYVAKVIEILNDNCFKIELNSKDLTINKTITFYSSNSTSLFPCKWCIQNNLKLETPLDWSYKEKSFDWDIYTDYLNKTAMDKTYTQTTDLNLFNWSRGLNQMSEKFQLGMYLECVDPEVANENESEEEKNQIIRLGQIKAKLAHLLFIKIIRNYSDFNEQFIDNSFSIFTVDSYDLFPVGWCEMNNYYNDNELHYKFYKYPLSLISNEFLKNIEIRSDLILRFNFLSKFKSINKFNYF